MRQACVIEDRPFFHIPKPLVELPRSQLCSEGYFFTTAARCSLRGELHQRSTNSIFPHRRGHGHPADLRSPAVPYDPQRPDHATVQESDEMRGDPVVIVDLELLRDPLFNDEDFVPQHQRCRHERVGVSNRNYLELRRRLHLDTIACHTTNAGFADLCSATKRWRSRANGRWRFQEEAQVVLTGYWHPLP